MDASAPVSRRVSVRVARVVILDIVWNGGGLLNCAFDGLLVIIARVDVRI